MLEARLTKASILKKLLGAVSDLVSDANLDCSEAGISLQAMDSSHVALTVLLLRAQGFEHYRCDRNMSIGVNIASLAKIVKCAGNDDIVTLSADEKGDVLNLLFESPNEDRTCEFELKLMDIDSEHLGIPDDPYTAVAQMSSTEFQRICRDISVMSESVTIDIIKDGIRFSAVGDSGKGSVYLKPKMKSVDDADEEMGDVKDEAAPKKKKRSIDHEDDEKKEKKMEVPLTIELESPMSLTLSLKYLLNFTKATPMSDAVILSMASNSPFLVEYKAHDAGYIRYYLAPKMSEDEEDDDDR